MTRTFAVLFAAAALVAPASAVAAGPSLPTDCHSLNKLLHIDNVRDCDNS